MADNYTTDTNCLSSSCTQQKLYRYLKDIEVEQLKDSIHKKKKRSSPFYFKPQKILGGKIIERIRLVLRYHQNGMELEDFTDFDFQIYTSRSKTLKEQTKIRLANPLSGCIPPQYENDSNDVHCYLDKRVQLYQLSKQELIRYKELQDELKDGLQKLQADKKPEKLFLIVADEAHWGITGADEDGKRGAHDLLINTWHEYKNVIVLLVTATAYNILTKDTRLPLDVFCAESLLTGKLDIVKPDNTGDDKVERLTNDMDEDVTDLFGPKRPLHHVKWTEMYNTRLEEGLKLTIRSLVTSSANECSKPVYLGPHHESNSNSDFVPFVGTDELDRDLCIIVKGKNEWVQLFDSNHRKLAVKRFEDREGYEIGFMSSDAMETNSEVVSCNFEMVMSFGEDVFALYPIIPDCRKKYSLYYDKTSKTVKVHSKPQALVLGSKNPEGKILVDLPVTDLFFMHKLEDINDSRNDFDRYLSLNYYYNTIWNEDKQDRKIRCDDSFELLCEVMIEKGHRRLDVFIAEYCIFVLVLSEFEELLTLQSAQCTRTRDVIEEIESKAKKIDEKIDTFLKKLNGQHFQERFVVERAVRDVRDYMSLREFKVNDHLSFWQSTLQACLCGSSDIVSDCFKELENYENCGLQTFLKQVEALKQNIISNYETGKIISDVMRMTEDKERRVQGYMKVIRTNSKEEASKLFNSLCMARDIASNDSPYLFDILKDDADSPLKDLYKGKADDRQYLLHLLLQQQRCATEKCSCPEYISNDRSVKCVNCNHPHNPVLKFEDLNGLPCIVILVEKGRMGDTFPSNFNCMDLRVRSPENPKKSGYELSSSVQELGRLCRYMKQDEMHGIPYVLLPRERVKHLKSETSKGVNQDGRATIYSSFLSSGTIDKHTSVDRRTLIHGPSTPDKDIVIPIEAGTTSFDKKTPNTGRKTNKKKKRAARSGAYSIENAAISDNRQKKTNMILLDAEPQCGKTGTYCCVIAELRKLICKEVSYDDINVEEGCSDFSEDEDEPVSTISQMEQQTSSDEETKWQYPYHLEMAKQKLNNKVTTINKYTRLHGPWLPGENRNYRHKFQGLGDLQSVGSSYQASTSVAPYKCETLSHTCSDCRPTVQKLPDPIDLKVVLNDFGYECKLYMSNVTKCPQLLEKLKSANVKCIPPLPEISPELALEYTDLKTWIFIPTAGRAKTACLNFKHTMRGPRSQEDDTEDFKSYVQILVVQQEEFHQYAACWGPRVTAIIQLPKSMKDEAGKDVLPVDGKIGYSRRFIQIFAQQLNLLSIFMLDDNVLFLKEAKFDDGKISRPFSESNAQFQCVSLYKVLTHMEKQYDVNTPKPTADFEPFRAVGVSLSNLEMYTGPHSNYAILGVRKARIGSQRVRNPFKKAHISSFVLVNVKATEENVKYPLWEVYEDLAFNERSDRNGLWVCKYNRFLLYKKQMKMRPEIVLWHVNTELKRQQRPPAENEVKYLASWINFFTSPRIKYRLGGEFGNKTLVELLRKVIKKRHERNHYLIGVDLISSNTPRAALQDVIDSTLTATGNVGPSVYIIVITTETCMQCSLRKIADFKKLLQMTFKEGFVLDIATSHNVTDYQVELLLISVQGEVINPLVKENDDTKMDACVSLGPMDTNPEQEEIASEAVQDGQAPMETQEFEVLSSPETDGIARDANQDGQAPLETQEFEVLSSPETDGIARDAYQDGQAPLETQEFEVLSSPETDGIARDANQDGQAPMETQEFEVWS